MIKFTIDIHPIHQAGRGDSCRAPPAVPLLWSATVLMVRLEMGVRVEQERKWRDSSVSRVQHMASEMEPGWFGKYPGSLRGKHKKAQGEGGCC